MNEIKMPPRKGLQIIKKNDFKNKMQDINTQDTKTTTQTNEILPSQEKTKIKIISFLGMTKTYKDVEDFQAKSEEEIKIKGLKEPKEAKYILTSDFCKVFGIEKHIEECYWSATECLLKEFNHNDFDFTLYGTKVSNKKQSPIYTEFKITPKEFDQKEYSKFLGDLINDLKNDFNSNKYKKIIIDITHGFRDNTILAIFAGLIQTNINKDFKINFIVAKEIIQQQEYEFISLDEYIENMVMSNVLSTFKQCLKVPDYNLDNPLYISLKNLSNALFKNQIQDIKKYLDEIYSYENNLPKECINLSILLDEIFIALNGIKQCIPTFTSDGKLKPKRIFYYELAQLYKNHDYSQNCVQFLLESLYLHIFNEFKQYLDKDNVDYGYQESKYIKNFLYRFEKPKPEEYAKKEQEQRNYYYDYFNKRNESDVALFNEIIDLCQEISELRNKMSHCDAFSMDINNEYKTKIDGFITTYQTVYDKKFSSEFKNNLKHYLKNRKTKSK